MKFTAQCDVTQSDTLEVFNIGPFVMFSFSDDKAVILSLGQLKALDEAIDAHIAAYDQPAPKPAPVPVTPQYSYLSEQAKMIYRHMDRAGSISAREAMDDYGITSATLARRICDIEEEGFRIWRDRRVHPITGKRYTRYSLMPN